MKFLKESAASAAALVSLGGCTMLSGSPPTAHDLRGQLTQAFEDNAMGDIYNASCSAVERRRDRNIRSPYGWIIPPAFRRDDDRLVIFSPDLPRSDRVTAEGAINRIPPHIMNIFYETGGVAVFTENSIVEAIPGYARTRKPDGSFRYYESVVGLHRKEERRIYSTFNLANVDEGEDGNPDVHNYRRVYDSQNRIVEHEVGHFMDYYLARKLFDPAHGRPGSLMRERSRPPGDRFTDGDIFRRAYEMDMDAIFAEGSSVGESWLSGRAYYFPQAYDGHEAHGEQGSERAARAELFAELWAEVNGYGSRGLKDKFPTVYSLLEQINNDLKDAYDAAGRSCDLEDLQRFRQEMHP